MTKTDEPSPVEAQDWPEFLSAIADRLDEWVVDPTAPSPAALEEIATRDGMVRFAADANHAASEGFRTLLADNERLRSALKPLAWVGELDAAMDPMASTMIRVGLLHAARQALSPSHNEVTDAERELIRHSLGLANSPKAYRNHFAAGDGHTDMPTINSLIAKGLMWKGRTATDASGLTFYHVTEAGCQAVGTTRAEAES